MDTGFLQNIFSKRSNILLFLSVFCLVVYLPGIAALPPFDRDESRFVQASKQMLETGNFIDIRFQDQPRYKKPIGIYWLQSSAVYLFAGNDLDAIWAYRLPSLAAAIAGVLLLFYFGEIFFDRKTGALAGLLLASCILLTTEAHLAKTDAVLFLCAVITQGSLGVIYLKKQNNIFGNRLMFWLGLGAGILIKGPVLPAINGLTMASLLVFDRDRAWLKKMQFLFGIPLVCLIVLPWLTAIYFITDGAFFKASLGGDMLAKVVSGQESHGAWPGYYFLLATATFFPASLFMFPSFFSALRKKNNASIRFCLAWLIPGWLMFEMVPTKLVHYVLPLYPALALLISERLLAMDNDRYFAKKSAVAAYLFWGLIGLVLVGIPVCASWFYGSGLDVVSIFSSLAAFLVVAAGCFFLFRRSWVQAATWVSLSMALLYGLLFQFVIPGLDKIWLSPRIADQINKIVDGEKNKAPVILTGFNEPSVVFLLGTDTKFGSGTSAGRFLIQHKKDAGRAVAVVEKKDLEAFAEVFDQASIPLPRPFGEVSGLNYSKGHWKEFTLYAFPE